MAVASYMSPVSPPPFAAQFAEVTVDIETGKVTVDRLVMAVDSGVIVNPLTASGQIEGGMTQALGYAVCEEMVYDDQGRRASATWSIIISSGQTKCRTDHNFIETFEAIAPVWVKAVAEIPMDGVAPAVAMPFLTPAERRWMSTRPHLSESGAKLRLANCAIVKKGEGTKHMASPIYVTGHVNPDTDSIAAAMGYAWLLRERDGVDTVAARAGAINPQTAWVLQISGPGSARAADRCFAAL
jgi:hypothetical protein